MLSMLRRKLGGMPVKLVGVDVEYTHYVKPQRAAVLQICVEKECLVYHISAAKDRSEYNYQSVLLIVNIDFKFSSLQLP